MGRAPSALQDRCARDSEQPIEQPKYRSPMDEGTSRRTSVRRGNYILDFLPATHHAQLTGRHADPGASGLVVLGDQDCRTAFPLSWSHLWSHSYRFGGVRGGLRGLGSGGTRPNRTGLNHQPQNSKAREEQPSAGSNPAATASLTRPNARLGASWAPAFLAVVSNVVSFGLD